MLGLVCLFLFMVAGQSTETNLIRNGDFSSGLEGWTVSNIDEVCAVRIDPDTKYGDKSSVILQREKPDVKTAGYLESERFPVKSGEIYLLECMVKGRDVPRNSPELLTTIFLSSTGALKVARSIGACQSSGPGPGGSLPIGTFDWQAYRYYARAFNNTDMAVIRFSAPTGGAMWVGDIRVTTVPVLRDVKYEIHGAMSPFNVTNAAPDGYLTDGIFARNQGDKYAKISEVYRGLEQGITINLFLPRVTMVDRLVFFLGRPNFNHSLRKIEVLCNKYGQYIKASEGPGYLTEEFRQGSWVIEAPVRQMTETLELKLFGGGHLTPTEILVVEGNKDKGEDMNKYILAGWVVMAATAATAVPEPVVIENEYVRMEFCPVEGGACKRLLYKPANKELVYAYKDAGYGLFRDRFWAPTWRDYADVVYQHEVTKTPISESIHLWGRGSGGIYNFTEVHKTITLTKGNPLIRAEYEIKNGEESFSDADYGFWVHNFLGVMGGKNLYFIPTTEGIMEVLNDPNQKKPEVWVRNPARGWMAGIGEGNHGLAWGVDYKYLNLFYQFLGIAVPTCEWQYNRIMVPCGKSLKTEITLMPFTGLERVDGFFQGIAGSIVLPAEVSPGGNPPASPSEALRARAAPAIGLVTAGDRKLTLKFRTRLLPATEWTEVGTREVEVKNAVLQKVAWPQELTTAAGTTVIGCEVMENGQIIGALERPLVVGAASGKYALAPECAQVGSKQPATIAAEASQIPEHKLSMEVVSPHVPWGKPYARGPLKALILTDCGHQREIVELMQRFDLEVETERLFFDTTYAHHEIGEQSVKTPAQAQARLKTKLQQPFDVIMIAGLHWEKTFDAETRKAILEKVKAGAGLVYVAPVGIEKDLQAALPFATGEKKGPYGFVELKQKHFLTDGVPGNLLPQIGSIMYAGQIPAEKVLLAQKNIGAKKEVPLLCTGDMGKGRVVCFLWNVYSHHLKGAGRGFSRITPLMYNENESKTFKPVMTNSAEQKVTWRRQEYIYSYLGKSLVWAANREPDLAVEIIARDEKGNVGVTLECPDGKRNVVLELTYRNKFSEDEKTDRQKAELAKGTNTFRFTPPADLMPGITLTDLRVLTPDGKVITWASGYYETRPALEIAGVEIEKSVVPVGDEPGVRGQVRLTGEAGADHVLEVVVTDFHDRLVFQQAFKATGTNTAFEARLLDALSIPITVEARLKSGNQVLDKRTETVYFLKKRAWDAKECCQYEWYTSPFGGRTISYLYDTGKRRVALMGITSIMDGPYYSIQDADNNAYLSPLGILDISDPKSNEKVNEYAKTKDRKCLVREPCLWDPAFREKAKQSMHNAASNAVVYGGGYSYCLGDEMALGASDFDFAPASVAAYREWLKKRYKTLKALNSEWETAYKDWAEIEPMTADEARKRENGNFAPWADFRSFMDDSLSDFFDYCQKCLEEVDPQAKVSISGTQIAAACNGMNWWKLCHSLKVLHSYYSGRFLHQSFSRATGALVAPYLNNACGRASGPVREGNMWWGVFYECFGLTSLGMKNYFFPDLTFSETGLETKNFLAEVRGGIWQLLRSVRRDPARIAILYSHPSIQANYIMNREQRYNKTIDAWVNILHDMGLQFDYVAYAQLEEKGFLAKQGYKAFILPECLALSDKEAAGLREFAKAGGVVIADNSAGWMNEHCRTLKTGQLDDMFGLAADREPVAGGKPKLTLKEEWDGLKSGETVAGFVPVGKVTPAKAVAVMCSDDPANGAIYRHPFGKGQAIYLNLSLVPYREERQMGGRGEMMFRQLIGGTLAVAGIRPEFVVTAVGKKAFHGHVVSFTDQDVRYLGIIREYGGGETEEAFAIRLPGKFHVYDVRAGKYLKQTDNINAVLYAGAAKLYALLPEEMKEPLLTCPADAVPGSRLACSVELSEPKTAYRVVRLEVYDPSGTLRTCYSGPQIIKPGETKAESAFMLALNDPAGEWTIKAVELLSGKTVERKLVVKK